MSQMIAKYVLACNKDLGTLKEYVANFTFFLVLRGLPCLIEGKQFLLLFIRRGEASIVGHVME